MINMLLIFAFSAQNGDRSNQTSTSVSQFVAEKTVPNFEGKTENEQVQIVSKINTPLRKIAHMTEFASLGALCFLFLLTWNGHLLLRYGSALAFSFVYACSDEWHQSFSNARGPAFSDVLIDLSGAFLSCTGLLLIAALVCRFRHRKGKNMQITRYQLSAPREDISLKIAIAADLHNQVSPSVLSALQAECPDLILIPGDLMDDTELSCSESAGYRFLRECAALAPTYYSLGNHEIRCYHKGNPWRHPIPVFPSASICEAIRSTGAVLLHDSDSHIGAFCICGLTSGINGKENRPNLEALDRFSREDGIKILLCHHPEYFYPYIEQTNIDLTVCGHAHGGQWRIFRKGIYAPGQGLFPKYTSGILEDRCVISRGLGNHTRIPRIGNLPELIFLSWGKTIKEIKKK